MADGAPPNPQPNPNDPWLEGLNLDQVGQLVNEVDPEVFYQRAAAFDQASVRFQEVLDLIRREMNSVHEAWRSKAAEDFDAVVRALTGKIDQVQQHLQNPGYGAVLRDAGGRLAQHQQRFRDLQGQKAAQDAAPPAPGADPAETEKVNNDSAKQILRDLRTAYWDVGNALTPLPWKPPSGGAVDADQGGRNAWSGGGGAGTSGSGDPGNIDNLAPTMLFGPTTLRKATPDRVGDGGPVLFGGQHSSVLGRADPVDAVDPGSGTPMPLFASGLAYGGSGALGQTRAVTDVPGADAPGDPSGVSDGSDIAVPGILGRSVSGAASVIPLRAKDKPTQRRERPVVEEPVDEEIELPEVTESSTVDTESSGVVAHPVSTATSGPPVATRAELEHALVTDASGKPQTFSFASGGGGGVHQVLNLDPGSHGVTLPGTTTADGLGGQPRPETITGAAAPTGRGVGADSAGAPHMGGMPMGMGMGMGMGGMGGNQQGRMAALPNEPRPEVWDPVTGSAVVVGRREREPEKDKPEEKLTQAEIQAALKAKFAELDRLNERGK